MPLSPEQTKQLKTYLEPYIKTISHEVDAKLIFEELQTKKSIHHVNISVRSAIDKILNLVNESIDFKVIENLFEKEGSTLLISSEFKKVVQTFVLSEIKFRMDVLEAKEKLEREFFREKNLGEYEKFKILFDAEKKYKEKELITCTAYYDLYREQCHKIIELDSGYVCLINANQMNEFDNYSEVLSLCNKALEILPLEPKAYALRAQAKTAFGDINGAKADLKMAKKLMPNTFDISIQLNLIELNIKEKKLEEAKIMLNEILEKNKNDLPKRGRAIIFNHLAEIARHENRVQEGLELINKAIELIPEDLDGLYHTRGLLLLRNHQLEEAEKNFEKVINKTLFPFHTYVALSQLKIEQKKFDEVMLYANKALEINLKEPDAYACRAEAWLSQKKFQEAVNDITRQIELKPTGDAYFNRFLVFFHLGKYSEALNDINKAIEFNPKDPIYLEQKSAFEKLIPLAKNIHAKNVINSLFQVATSRFQEKKYDDAIKISQNIVEHYREKNLIVSSNIYEFMVEAMKKRGDTKNKYQSYEKKIKELTEKEKELEIKEKESHLMWHTGEKRNIPSAPSQNKSTSQPDTKMEKNL